MISWQKQHVIGTRNQELAGGNRVLAGILHNWQEELIIGSPVELLCTSGIPW